MVILFPFPGFISNLIKRAQEEGIKRVYQFKVFE